MSIHKLALTLSALAIFMIAGVSSIFMVGAWSDYGATNRALEIVHKSRIQFTLASVIRAEQIAFSVLSRNFDDAGKRADVERFIIATDAALAEAGSAFGSDAEVMKSVELAGKEISKIRSTLWSMVNGTGTSAPMSLPDRQKDVALRSLTYAPQIAALDPYLIKSVKDASLVSPPSALSLNLALTMLRLRTAGGDANVEIRKFAADHKSATPDAIILASGLVGAARAGIITVLEQYNADKDAYAADVQAAYSVFMEKYVKGHMGILEKGLAAAMTDGKYPLDGPTYSVVGIERAKELITLRDTFVFAALHKAQDHNKSALIKLWTVSGFGLALILSVTFAGWYVVRKVVSPLRELSRVMTLSAAGEHCGVPYSDRKDEIGAMAQAVSVFIGAMRTASTLSAERQEQDLMITSRSESLVHHVRMFEVDAGRNLEGFGSNVEAMVITLRGLSDASSTSTREASAVADLTASASSNVSMVSVSATQMAASVAEIARQADHATRATSEAVVEATGAQERVKKLSESAQKIGEVVNLIKEIAQQTNLLALNATIEAARAGDAGKGFAVVASEVKNLSMQTARATEEITIQIEEMQASTGTVVAAIDGITATISTIDDISSSIAAAIEEQGAATREISRNADEASKGVSLMSDRIQNAAVASAMAAEGVVDLGKVADELKLGAGAVSVTVRDFATLCKAA